MRGWPMSLLGQGRRRQPLAQGCAFPLFPESDGRQSESSLQLRANNRSSIAQMPRIRFEKRSPRSKEGFNPEA
jgi:hypothetical protein